MSNKLYTIGHSNHPIEILIAYLDQYQINTVFDVRSNPYSRFHPQYRQDALKKYLGEHEIRYLFYGKELGAKPNDTTCYVKGRVNFNRLAATHTFREGLNRLSNDIKSCRGCLLCAEKEPLSCHRTLLICRHLRHGQIEIAHILADGSLEEHRDTEKRLIQMPGLPQMELFSENDDLVETAYNIQGEKIAYHRK